MRVLVDSHSFLWLMNGDKRLSKRAKAILTSDEHEILFSYVSLWEIAVKIQIGRLPEAGSSIEYIHDELREHGIELLPIRFDHIVAFERLPMVKDHKDPFDRFLIAQAVSESLPILTHDRYFVHYPVKIVW